MPKVTLRERKHIKIAQALLDGKPQVRAYMSAYPGSSLAAAYTNGPPYIRKNHILQLAQKIAESEEKTSLEYCVRSLQEQVGATQLTNIGGKIREIPDHSIRLQTKKFLLEKIYGLDTNSENPAVMGIFFGEKKRKIFNLSRDSFQKLKKTPTSERKPLREKGLEQKNFT